MVQTGFILLRNFLKVRSGHVGFTVASKYKKISVLCFRLLCCMHFWPAIFLYKSEVVVMADLTLAHGRLSNYQLRGVGAIVLRIDPAFIFLHIWGAGMLTRCINAFLLNWKVMNNEGIFFTSLSIVRTLLSIIIDIKYLCFYCLIPIIELIIYLLAAFYRGISRFIDLYLRALAQPLSAVGSRSFSNRF